MPFLKIRHHNYPYDCWARLHDFFSDSVNHDKAAHNVQYDIESLLSKNVFNGKKMIKKNLKSGYSWILPWAGKFSFNLFSRIKVKKYVFSFKSMLQGVVIYSGLIFDILLVYQLKVKSVQSFCRDS